jgi:ketosteroid isomerase-like protein
MTPDEFLREYESSGKVGGVENTMRLIDDAAVYWFSDATAHVGKQAIERVFRQNQELIREETYRIGEVVWVARSVDVAVCIFRFDWSGLVHGSPAAGSGRGTLVLSRRGESWSVVHEHLSKGPHAA